ncbi:hypothetical protein Bca4012_025584 [Brassica carinata]
MIDVNLKVESLLRSDGQWDVEKLQELFPVNEAQRSLQLTVGEVSDREIWAFTPQGSYTVKSGYALASKIKYVQGMNSLLEDPGILELKRMIWKLPTIPKIRSFLWRAISGALAVAERLNIRGMQLDSTCKLCSSGSESIVHLLFQCPVAVDVWQRMGLPLSPNHNSMQLGELLSSHLKLISDASISLQQRQAIPWILWTLWKNRNSILYADTQVSLDLQLQQACEEARVWNELISEPENTEAGGGLLNENKKWEPPMHGFAKCNIHANWRNARLHSGGVFVIRDHTGNVLHHARKAFTFSPNRLTAELRCLEWALQSMKDLLDLLDAVKRTLEWPRFRIILQRIRSLCMQFSFIAFESESLDFNRIAREIAKSVLRDGRFQSYLALGGPAWLHQLISGEAVLSCS